MKVNVWRYADEENPSDMFIAEAAGLVAENTIHIILEEGQEVYINNFYKVSTEMTKQEIAEYKAARAEAERLANLNQLGNKLGNFGPI